VKIARGYSDAVLHMAFALWAVGQPKVPRAIDIQNRFGVDPKTGAKWRRELMALRAPTHPLHRLAATGSAHTSQEAMKK
jgi:hypothetical protein